MGVRLRLTRNGECRHADYREHVPPPRGTSRHGRRMERGRERLGSAAGTRGRSARTGSRWRGAIAASRAVLRARRAVPVWQRLRLPLRGCSLLRVRELGHTVRTKLCYFGSMPVCTRCHKDKEPKDFYAYSESDPHKTGKLHATCKRCQHDARAAHRKANPAMASANARRCKIKRLFGITPEQYDEMLTRQGGTCAICHRESPDGRRLHIDHDHDTKRVRGLLCHDCNRGLGMFKDDIARFQRAIAYLG